MTMQPVLGGRGDAGAVTAAEIASQPKLWPKAVEAGMAATALQERMASGTTLYMGCGSTAHLARALAFTHRQSLPTFAWAEAASEVWLASGEATTRAQTVVAVSRSGETTETIKACRRPDAPRGVSAYVQLQG